MSDTRKLAYKRRRLTPLLLDARRLARLLCCSLRSIRSWDAAGELPAPLRLGGRVLWRLDEIRAWVKAGLPDRAAWTAMKSDWN